MRKAEIKKHFDAIVDFAGVERYIDTPVKRYSSGMYVRLAFAVAAHLESEILVVDEVLAVGDAEFQKKCLGKMNDVSKGEGRTVLFVSHNMGSIKQLCKMGLLLENGKLSFNGLSDDCISTYQKSTSIFTNYENKSLEEAPGNDLIKILSFNIKPHKGDILTISSGVVFELKILNNIEKNNLGANFELRSIDDTVVFYHATWVFDKMNSEKGVYQIKGIIEPHILNSGTYKFNLLFGSNKFEVLFAIQDFIQFEILNEELAGNFMQFPGIIRPNLKYEITKV
jgi:lipopolysaccharide transport system ATP-binding protein